MQRKFFVLIFFIAAVGVGYLAAQDAVLPDDLSCDPDELANLQQTFADIYAVGGDDAAQHLFVLGALYQQMALQCGYIPSVEEVDALIEQTLSIAPLPRIIAATAVGEDVPAILAELDRLTGDSFNGQLLYNGLAPGIDGTPLGCTDCHNNIAVAPLTEGTYTRVETIRLRDPALADYTVQQYLIESIVRPTDYIIPDYANQVMPANYGTRLDIQQLADLIAYLESQDQLLNDE